MGALRIAVAGCGPAGLAAALLLHRDGHRVTLFERFEEPRPLGSGLMIQPTGRAVLQQLGLDEVLLAHGARIHRLIGKAEPVDRTVLDVSYSSLRRPDTFGIGIHRASLFEILHRAVVADGIAISTRRCVVSSEQDGTGRRLFFADGTNEGPFDLVVDALGFRSPLAPPCGRELAYGALWATLDWPEHAEFSGDALEQRYRAASTMAGVLPIGTAPGEERPKAAFFWSLRADRLDDWRDRGLDPWKEDVLRLWPAVRPLLDQMDSPDCLTFARYSHRTAPAPVGSNLIAIGDAWHSASPQLGQGANMAMLDAYALRLALRRFPAVPEAVHHAVRLRRYHVLLYQFLTALFTPVYQSDSRLIPIVRDRLVGPLSRLWPATWIQAAMVSGLIGKPLDRLELHR